MLEKKKLEAELARVYASRLELELRIEERLAEIENLKSHIEKQVLREKELTAELNKLK